MILVILNDLVQYLMTRSILDYKHNYYYYQNWSISKFTYQSSTL